MTKLVLEPEQLPPLLVASVPERVRLIMQTVGYDMDLSVLLLVTFLGRKMRAFLRLESFDIECAKKGCVIDATGYYDGESVELVDIVAVEDHIGEEQLAVLRRMCGRREDKES